MARYRLTAQHFICDQLLEEGTVVGDDTPFPLPDGQPTGHMIGLDDEANQRIDQFLREGNPQAIPAGSTMVVSKPGVGTRLVSSVTEQPIPGTENENPSDMTMRS